MERIDKEITVNTPIEKVFKYLENPVNWPEFWSNIIKITDVEPLPAGGYKAIFAYKMVGMRFNGEGGFTKYIPNQQIVVKVKGGIKSTITFTFRSVTDKLNLGKTRIILSIIYEIPVPLVGKFAEIFIRNTNEHDIDLLLINLSARFLLKY